MNEITMAAWENAIKVRDITYLNLVIIAATLLAVYRLFIAARRTLARAVVAAGSIFFVGLLAVGVWQLWTL